MAESLDRPWYAFYEEGVPYTIDVPSIPLYTFVDDAARDFPNKVGIKMVLKYLPLGLSIHASMTYRELQKAVHKFASALHRVGVRPGDRVAIMLPNTPQYVVAFMGALRAGAIAVNTNPTYTPRELAHQMKDSGAETIVMLSPFYERLQAVRDEVPIKRVIITDIPEYVKGIFKGLTERTLRKEGLMVDVPEQEGVYHWQTFMGLGGEPPAVQVDPDEVALFQYTGGTTGVPKAAMLTHRNLVANAMQVAGWIPGFPRGEVVMMGALPFFHVYGMTVSLLLGLHNAGRVVMVPNPRPIDIVMQTIHHERCNLFPGVPTMYIAIINHPEVHKYDLKSVEACISGAAPLPVEVQQKFEAITGGRLVEGYGLTEASPVTHSNPLRGRRKVGSIGLPLPSTDAKVVDMNTGEALPPGGVGELCVKGPQVMKGYWNRPEETELVLDEEGWLHTGDIARMDEEGYFYIVDRKKDIIIASGYNIIPREVEEVLYMHPKVLEAVVAGVPDPYRGETVKAYIVLKPGEQATAEEIIEFCREHLAPYKVPKLVEFRSELPKSQVGKFLRRVLVEEEKKKLAQKEGK